MASYRRLSQGGGGPSSSSDSLEASLTQSRTERLADKVTAVVWILLAVIVTRWSSFFSVIWSSEEANRFLLRIAALGFGIVTSLVLYLTVYLPRVKGLKADSAAWGVYCPKVIPTVTAGAILTFLIALRGTWPVWGYLSPLIYGTQLMGAVMSLHFVPAGNKC